MQIPITPGAASAPQPSATEDGLLAALVDRCTNGYTPEEHALAQSLGYDGYLEYHLAPTAIGDADLAAKLDGFGTLSFDGGQFVAAFALSTQASIFELRQAAVLRAALSKRQLFERVVELFGDHFNIYHLDGLCGFFKTIDDRTVVRRYALRSFPEMLAASSRSAAMSFYLDNHLNKVGAAQENYARELLELHTIGIREGDAGFSEDDVKDVARAFTGWGFDWDLKAGFGTFQFELADHDQGSKDVLGLHLPPFGGQADGEAVLAHLGAHPSTARTVATKVARWFLAHDPPETIVDALVDVYTSTGGDLPALVRATLARENLLAVRPWEVPKLKRPLHFAASLIRAASVDVQNPLTLLDGLNGMGQVPFNWSAPDGYPDSFEAWSASLLPRWEFATKLLSGGYFGSHFDPDAFLTSIGAPTQGDLAQAIDRRLTGGRSPHADVEVVQRFVDRYSGLSPFVVREAVSLAAALPRFQVY